MERLSHRLALTCSLAVATSVLVAADNPQQAVARSWEGRTVVLKQPLYTLVYNERTRLGKTNSGKRDGLTVVTPFNGTYFQFDGRRGREDVTEPQPHRLIESVKAAYISDALLDLSSVVTIEPLLVNRYEAGVECVVRKLLFGRDTVRLVLAPSDKSALDQDPVTWLTVKWPVPLSKSLSERNPIEDLVRRYIEVKPAP